MHGIEECDVIHESPESETQSCLPDLVIHCSLVKFEVDALSTFQTLSYTWGDPISVYDSDESLRASRPGSERCFPIRCDGETLMVTSNLHEFLVRYLRTHDPHYQHVGQDVPKYLWIDAICINQSDVSERSAQVLFMNFIYRYASKVLVWVGEQDAFTGLAL